MWGGAAVRAVLALRFLRRRTCRRNASVRWGFAVDVLGLVFYPNQAEARERQEFVYMLNLFCTASHEACLSASGNHDCVRLELYLDAGEHAIDHIDRAVVQASLHVGYGVGSDDFAGVLDFDTRKTSGAAEQRFRSDADTGSDDAAEIFALCGDYIERDGRSKIDDNARAAVFLKCGDAVHDAVGSDFHRIIDEDGHAGFYARFDEQRALVQVQAGHFSQRPVHRRYNGTDYHPGDLFLVQPGKGKKVAGQHAILVHSLRAGSGQAPVGNQIFSAKNAQHRVCVSDVYG